MAAYSVLFPLRNEAEFLGKISVAVAAAAYAVSQEDPGTDIRRTWARRAINDPEGEAQRAVWLIIGQYKALTLSQIKDADDATIQGAVDGMVNLLALSAE